MTGTKTAPRSSSTPAISSSAFSPVAYSKMDNIMKYNAIQQRINSLSTIYENLKETTYNMDNTIMNMWKNWADDNDNKFNTYLINYTLDCHNSRMNERLKRIDNLYDHIYQLEKERDLINIEEEESEEEESEDEQEYHPRLFGRTEEKPQTREEEESEDEQEYHPRLFGRTEEKPQTREEEIELIKIEESEEEEEEDWKIIYNENVARWYDPRFRTIYYSINLHLKRDIRLYELEKFEYTYNELMDFYDDIKNVINDKTIEYTLRTLYKDFVLKAVAFTIFINYYKECVQDVIIWKKLPNIMVENIKEQIETQINRIDEIFYVLDSMGVDGLPYKPYLKNCHKMNMINITNYNKL